MIKPDTCTGIFSHKNNVNYFQEYSTTIYRSEEKQSITSLKQKRSNVYKLDY